MARWRLSEGASLPVAMGGRMSSAEFRQRLADPESGGEPSSQKKTSKISVHVRNSQTRVAALLEKHRDVSPGCPHASELVRFVSANEVVLAHFASDLEHVEQVSFFYRLKHEFPEVYRYAFAVPNGGARRKGERFRLQAEGQKGGIPDVLIHRRFGAYVGVAIEFKRKEGKPSDVRKDQRERLALFSEEGWLADVAFGCDAGIEILKKAMKSAEGLP